MTSTNQPTPRESKKNLTLSTLENILIQNTLGANLASDKTMYGTKGAESAKHAFNGEEIKKAKEEQYQELEKEYESMGVAGKPTYPSDADISYKIISGLENVMKTSYLEDIAEAVNKFVPELKFNLPDKLKGNIYAELIRKAMTNEGKVDIGKLNEDEKTAIGVYENLREAYRLTAAKKVNDSDYLGDVKKQLNAVMEKYNPTKEGKIIKMEPQEYEVAA